jgi:pimeloyl-ACP methyl ester carboxylesterase
VCGLVLVDPAIPHPPDIESDPVVNAVFSTYATPGSGEEFLEKNARTLTPERSVDQRLELQCVDPARVPTVVRDAMIERTRERASLPWVTRAFLEAARSLMALNADPDRYHEMIRSISKPTLLVHGARDRLIPLGAADAIAALQPRWRYVVIPDIGHIPHVEATGEFVRAVLAWLGDNRAEDDLVASTRRG